ncbi:MAG TPA: hypothetical protein VJN96_12940 [Vicinamibacterales bacterium]|nr:hypothetical protein [Vicinamibacterales bacterium]
MPSRLSRRLSAEESRLVAAWARLGDADELTRICKDILTRTRPRQGYVVALEAQHIIEAHLDHWRLDTPVDTAGTRKHRALLKSGPKVVGRLERALNEMIDLHRKAEGRRWYGKKLVAGLMKPRRPDGSFVNSHQSWTRFPQLYEQTLKALETDPLWLALRDTPTDMWLIPPRGNPQKRRNGALRKALRSVGLTTLQIDDVIQAVGWTIP